MASAAPLHHVRGGAEARAAGPGRRTRGRGTTRRFGALPIVVAGVAVVLAFVVSTVVVPALRITRIFVHGDYPASRDDVVQAATGAGSLFWHTVDTDALADTFAAWPGVEGASVERVFPDALRITIDRRRPAFVVVANDSLRGVDADGMVFPLVEARDAIDLPILDIPDTIAATDGSAVPEAWVPGLRALATIDRHAPELTMLISEIVMVPRRIGAADVRVYFEGYPTPVLFNASLSQDALRYAVLLLDLLQRRGALAGIVEFDFRGGEIVYRVEEEPSGR